MAGLPVFSRMTFVWVLAPAARRSGSKLANG
jgi:hypothetical protein